MHKLDEPIPGLMVLQTAPHRDERGAFTRSYCRENFRAFGLDEPIEQGNLSFNVHKGTLRGLHLQRGDAAEIKIVQCLEGAIYDVGVDMRENSPTFKHWYGTILSPQNGLLMLLPKGFAHGFLSLYPNSLVNYLVTAAYQPDAEVGFRFDDPAFNIDWPMEPTVISARDRGHPMIVTNNSEQAFV